MDLIAQMDTIDEGDRPTDMDNEGGMPEDLTLPPKRYEKLEANGELYDLRKPQEAREALEATQDYREDLREGELEIYEDKPTEPFGGGRTRLFYDELRAKMAHDYHEGKHDLSWEQQHEEAQRIIKIRATQFRAERT